MDPSRAVQAWLLQVLSGSFSLGYIDGYHDKIQLDKKKNIETRRRTRHLMIGLVLSSTIMGILIGYLLLT